MITDTFDNNSPAIINPVTKDNAFEVDACILTFSNVIEEYVVKRFKCRQIGAIWFATGCTPIYLIEYAGLKFAFYKTYVGTPA